MKMKFVCLIISAFLLSACSTRITDFTMITSKNIDISRMPSFHRDVKRVQGEDASHIIIFIPTGVPNAKEALDRAIESVPGAVALLDGVMTHKYFYIPYIYGKSWYVVEGTALIDPELLPKKSESPKMGKYNILYLNESGETQRMSAVSKETYESLKNKRI